MRTLLPKTRAGLDSATKSWACPRTNFNHFQAASHFSLLVYQQIAPRRPPPFCLKFFRDFPPLLRLDTKLSSEMRNKLILPMSKVSPSPTFSLTAAHLYPVLQPSGL